MATCKDCVYADFCEQIPSIKEFNRDNIAYCQAFKNKANFVEVVRCKDCKYLTNNNDIPEELKMSQICLRQRFWVQLDDYCSYGRKCDNG